jgi:hypothetical protein
MIELLEESNLVSLEVDADSTLTRENENIS